MGGSEGEGFVWKKLRKGHTSVFFSHRDAFLSFFSWPRAIFQGNELLVV